MTEATMFAAIEKRAVNPPWAALFLLLLLPPFFLRDASHIFMAQPADSKHHGGAALLTRD